MPREKQTKVKVFHVVKSVQGWKIEEEGSMWSLFRTPIKSEAIDRALELVKKEKECRLVIHDEDGAVVQEKSFFCRPTRL
jgi:hypothetical protein